MKSEFEMVQCEARYNKEKYLDAKKMRCMKSEFEMVQCEARYNKEKYLDAKK
jgi:hypothetical protein